jgi:hypothetical protein
MKRIRLSLARIMAIVAVLAVDCALLSTCHIFYPEMLLFVPGLQIGLFRMVPGRGRVKPYWVGFELFGWTGVLAWYFGLSGPMGRCFDYSLSHLVGFLAAHYPGLFHLLKPLFNGDGLLMEAIGILLWGAIVSSPLLLIACLGGRLTLIRATQWKPPVETSLLSNDGTLVAHSAETSRAADSASQDYPSCLVSG